MRFCQQNSFEYATKRGPGLSAVALVVLGLLLWPVAADACVCITGTLVIDTTVTTNCVEITESGCIYIGTSGTLVLDGQTNGSGQVSTLDGCIVLSQSGATLRIATNDHTITGSGSIIGQNNGAKIEIADSLTLTSEVTIEGALRIKEVNPATESATFVNQGLVDANTAGTLEVTTATIRDSIGRRWSVSNADATLLFSDDATGSDKLVGNFDLDYGTLDIDEDITTSGTLDQSGGMISVAAGKTFQAG